MPTSSDRNSLWSNALKHSTPSTPVTVSAMARNGEVDTSVTDHGPGIPPHDLPRLFECYFRTEAGREQREGLGPYITRCLVEAHGERIWVVSEVGVRSTFSFSLPTAGAADQGTDGTEGKGHRELTARSADDPEERGSILPGPLQLRQFPQFPQPLIPSPQSPTGLVARLLLSRRGTS